MTADQDIEALYRLEYSRLVGVVTLVTESKPVAEEAVQEAFARALDRVRRGQSFDHLAGWLVTVALNEARSGRRRRATERRALDRWDRGSEADDEIDNAVATGLRTAIAELAHRQRQAVVLYYLLDLDVGTVARLLRVSEGTVKSALSRARERLQSLLDEREVEA